MPRFSHHKYTWSKPFSSVRHQWELVGPEGGIHFHASGPYKGEWSCGLEVHRAKPDGVNAPSQTRCWLLDGPCWHDGTSLYAQERLWPIFESYLRSGDHENIFRVLEGEYDQFFNSKSEAA